MNKGHDYALLIGSPLRPAKRMKHLVGLRNMSKLSLHAPILEVPRVRGLQVESSVGDMPSRRIVSRDMCLWPVENIK